MKNKNKAEGGKERKELFSNFFSPGIPRLDGIFHPQDGPSTHLLLLALKKGSRYLICCFKCNFRVHTLEECIPVFSLLLSSALCMCASVCVRMCKLWCSFSRAVLLQLALRAAPSYEDFVAALTIKEGDHQKAAFSVGMQRDLSLYLPAMEKQLAILDTLYEIHGLESDEVV